MEWKEYRAKTVSSALTDAAIDMQTTSDMIEYEVIEEGSTGILKLFSKDAIIRARKKVIIEETEVFAEEKKTEEKTVDITEEKAVVIEKKAEEKVPVKAKQPNNKPNNSKTEAVKKKEIKPASPSAVVKVDNETVREVLNAIFEKLGIAAEITMTVDEAEKVMNVVITGDDTGDIIGKRGQTLDAIQYLISIIVNKKQDNYYRVKLDTNNYRERRQKTLENLAKNVAGKVKKTRRKVALEPMNPYERRVIHSYLQSDRFVTTKSEGEEPNRRVVVYYKKS